MLAIADALLPLGLLPKQRIALVDEDGLAMALDVSIQFCLSLDDAFEATEAF